MRLCAQPTTTRLLHTASKSTADFCRNISLKALQKPSLEGYISRGATSLPNVIFSNSLTEGSGTTLCRGGFTDYGPAPSRSETETYPLIVPATCARSVAVKNKIVQVIPMPNNSEPQKLVLLTGNHPPL